MAVKTEQQLLAECASGSAITSSMMVDLINTMFSSGGGGGADEPVDLQVAADSTIEGLLSDASVTLSGDTLLIVTNHFASSYVVTLADDGSGNTRTVTIPAYSFVFVWAYKPLSGDFIFLSPASVIS